MIQLKNKATGEIGTIDSFDLLYLGGNLYEYTYQGGTLDNPYASRYETYKDVTSDYEIMTGTRSRSEIKDKIEKLKSNLSNCSEEEKICSNLIIRALEWVLNNPNAVCITNY